MHTIRLVLPFFIFLFLFLTPAYSLTILNTDINDVMTNGTYYSYGGSITTLGLANGATNKSIFVMFDLSSLSGITISSVDANLSMYFAGNYGNFNGNIYLYNTTNTTEKDWNETVFVAPSASKLISTTFLNYSSTCSPGDTTCGSQYWVNFSISSALLSALKQGKNLSLQLTMRNTSITGGPAFWSKEGSSLKPRLIINYNVADCAVDCGDCGCALDGSGGCFVPTIIGSYCDVQDGLPNTIRTVPNSSCTGMTTFECPSQTLCTQVTPEYNFSGSDIWSSQNNTNWCAGCYFVNLWNPFKSAWVPITTNCLNTGVSIENILITPWNLDQIKFECECSGPYCADMYTTNDNSTFVSIIPEWTAGCWNLQQGKYYNIINGTGQNTTVGDLIHRYVNNTTQVNNTKYMCDKINTTTNCYDLNCNSVQCANLAGSSCSSNYGGSIALQVGGLMGITDCSMSMWVLSMLLSLATGFGVLYYGRDKKIGINGFVVGTLGMLIMFTLVGWFPAWVMIIFIVISAYLMAKGIGLGGG